MTLTGSAFTGASAVKFGTKSVAITLSSSTSISLSSPALTGKVAVTVTTPGGTSKVSKADYFTYSASDVTLTTTSLKAGVKGKAYSDQLAAKGGSGGDKWSVTGLPANLKISTTGLLSGTPKTTGSFKVKVEVKSGTTNDTRVFTLVVRATANEIERSAGAHPRTNVRSVHRAFTFRLDPTVKQSRALRQCMDLQCELYNAALEERRGSYRYSRRGLSSAGVPNKLDQFRTLTGLFDLRPELKPFGVTVCRGTLTRLDQAFTGFFRRVRAGQAPGYPRFKSRARFDSLSRCDISGWKLDEDRRRLYIRGVGHAKVTSTAPLGGGRRPSRLGGGGAISKPRCSATRSPRPNSPPQARPSVSTSE